jgi:hypothetical protein
MLTGFLAKTRRRAYTATTRMDGDSWAELIAGALAVSCPSSRIWLGAGTSSGFLATSTLASEP